MDGSRRQAKGIRLAGLLLVVVVQEDTFRMGGWMPRSKDRRGGEGRGAANKEGGEELLGILKSLWTLSINIKGKNNIQQANLCFESTYGETIAVAGKACGQL